MKTIKVKLTDDDYELLCKVSEDGIADYIEHTAAVILAEEAQIHREQPGYMISIMDGFGPVEDQPEPTDRKTIPRRKRLVIVGDPDKYLEALKASGF